MTQDTSLLEAHVGHAAAIRGSAEVPSETWQRLCAGDVDALRLVYVEHNVAVRAFAARLLGDEAIAEDLVQDVFLTLPKTARAFRGLSSQRSYLIGIAAHRASKFIRSAARQRAAHVRLERHEQLRAQRPPDEDAHARALVERLMRALDLLPENLRIAFVLCQIEERDASEVGRMLGIPASTVRARLAAARERLQASHLDRKELL